MTELPNSITRLHLLEAKAALDAGEHHGFGMSTDYDVLHEGRRYAPKAVVGIAAISVLGKSIQPHGFVGGLNTKCFRILEQNELAIVEKISASLFSDEVPKPTAYTEGHLKQVFVNKYERDPSARLAAIEHHGHVCKVCGTDFESVYGKIGKGFIHVHHVVPLHKVNAAHLVNPITDLIPVCPNCHAMLHRLEPPNEVAQLQAILARGA